MVSRIMEQTAPELPPLSETVTAESCRVIAEWLLNTCPILYQDAELPLNFAWRDPGARLLVTATTTADERIQTSKLPELVSVVEYSIFIPEDGIDISIKGKLDMNPEARKYFEDDQFNNENYPFIRRFCLKDYKPTLPSARVLKRVLMPWVMGLNEQMEQKK